VLPSLALLLAITAAPAFAQDRPPGPDNLVLSCAGPFAKDSTHDRLVEVFGARNVAFEEVHIGEGEQDTASVIYPKDRARRVEVLWADARRRTRPAVVRVEEAKSRWTLAAGFGPGATLAQVEKANGGAPFELSGFDWDYGGRVTEWNGALAAGAASGCALTVRFAKDPKASEKAAEAVSGDRTFRSSDPRMRAVRPRVEGIGLSVRQG
jgi:hypothetical protein